MGGSSNTFLPNISLSHTGSLHTLTKWTSQEAPDACNVTPKAEEQLIVHTDNVQHIEATVAGSAQIKQRTDGRHRSNQGHWIRSENG